MPAPRPAAPPPPRIGLRTILARIAPTAAATLVFLVAACWCLQGTLGRWTTAYTGGSELEGWLWRYWWMKQLIADAFRHASLEYAVYVTLVSGSYPEAGNVADLQWFSVPLEILAGSPAYYNWKVLLFLVLNGLSGYWLARLLVKEWWSSVLCGLAFGFSSYILLEIDIGRIRHAGVFPLALYAFFLVKLYRRDAPLYQLILAGVTFGLCTSMFLFYGMSAFFLTGMWLVSLASPPAGSPPRHSWLYGAGVLTVLAAVVVAMALGSPPRWIHLALVACLVVPVAMAVRRDGVLRLQQLLIVAMVAFLCSTPYATWYIRQAASDRPLPEVAWQRDFPSLEVLLHPQNVHTIDDNLTKSLPRFRGDSLSFDFPFLPTYRRSLPVVFTFIALGGLLVFRRRPWLWVAVASLGYLLTLGPYLKQGVTEEYVLTLGPLAFDNGIRLPHTLFFKYVPFFARLFSPVRMEGLFLLGFGVLVAWSTATVFERLRLRPMVRGGIFAVVVGLVAVQAMGSRLVPLGLTEVNVPEVYPWVASQPVSGILELPFKEGDFTNYYQIFHQKRVLGGWGEGSLPEQFPPSRTRDLAELQGFDPNRNTFVSWLRRLNGEHASSESSFRPSDLDSIRRAGYRYAVLHERGCCVVRGPDGRQHYQKMREILGGLFGPPLRVCKELVRDGPVDGRPADGEGRYSYEITVYDVGTAATGASIAPSPRPGPSSR